MSSAFLSIQTALIAALAASVPLAGGRIYPNRLRPIAAEASTAIVVRLDVAEGSEYVIGCVDWATPYAVECYARAAPGADPAVAVDTLLCDVWARLGALTYEAAGGAEINLAPRIDWQFDETDTALACAVVRVTARHRTTTQTITGA